MTAIRYHDVLLDVCEADCACIYGLKGDEWSVVEKEKKCLLRIFRHLEPSGKEAYDFAKRLILSISALMRMRYPEFEGIALKNVVHPVNKDGQHGVTIMVPKVEIKMRTLPPTIIGENRESSSTDGIISMIDLSLNNNVVEKVLRLRDKPTLSWVDLYRIFETVETDENPVDKGWISKTERKRFHHTANSIYVIGDEARHGKETTQPPKTPMPKKDALSMVDRIIELWLSEKTNRT